MPGSKFSSRLIRTSSFNRTWLGLGSVSSSWFPRALLSRIFGRSFRPPFWQSQGSEPARWCAFLPDARAYAQAGCRSGRRESPSSAPQPHSGHGWCAIVFHRPVGVTFLPIELHRLQREHPDRVEEETSLRTRLLAEPAPVVSNSFLPLRSSSLAPGCKRHRSRRRRHPIDRRSRSRGSCRTRRPLRHRPRRSDSCFWMVGQLSAQSVVPPP